MPFNSVYHKVAYPLTEPGDHAAGCSAYTVWMPSGGLLCPRWCITYKDGKSNGRHGCFGVVWYDEVQPTVSPRPFLCHCCMPPHLLTPLGCLCLTRVLHPDMATIRRG